MSIIKNGNKYSIVNFDATYDQLPKGNYILRFSPMDGYFLEEKEAFSLPPKIYGDHSIVSRWLRSWENNSAKNLGILLTGLKGAGKTITAQKFCIDSGLPVILISEEFYGSDFVNFLTKKEIGPAIVFIDEFEKIYSHTENQFDLLSLMDGNFSTKLVFLLTVNAYRINDYLINRPNRIKYVKQYGDLDASIIEEVIEDMLVNKEHKASIYTFLKKVNMSTFDILTSLIKEMNLFQEDAIECGKHLNLRSEPRFYEVFETFRGKEYPCHGLNLASDAKSVEVSRRDTDYLPDDVDAEGEYIFDHQWRIDLEFEKCEVTEINDKDFIVKDVVKNLEFRFCQVAYGDYKIVF